MNRADVHQLFHSQFGVADLAQLVSLGLSPSTVLRTQRRGTIEPVLPGVFQIAGTRCQPARTGHGGPAALWVSELPQRHDGRGRCRGARAMPMSRVEITIVGKVRTHPAPWVRVRRSVLDRDERHRDV